MPKGRGSNKTGKGPTPPKTPVQPTAGGLPPHVELLVTRQQLEQALLEKRDLQMQLRQAMQLAIAALSTKRSKSATLTANQLAELDSKYAGINLEQNEENDSVVLSLVEREAQDAAEST